MDTIETIAAHDLAAARDAAAALRPRIEAACEQACRAIAPAWPLDRAIAVNPHWSRIGRPVREVAARMAVLGGIRVLPPRAYLKQAREEGRITDSDLTCALAELSAARTAGLTAAHCIEALQRAVPVVQLPLLIDVLDDDPARHARLSWRQAITHQVGQTCAAYFDQQQADWQPERGQGLYAFWRDTLTHDHSIGVLMGLPELGRSLAALPQARQGAEQWVLQRLGLPEVVWADYLEAVLLTVNGWASWCAYLGWQAGLEGRSDAHLRDLLAIRLAWGVILLECKDDAGARRAFAALQADWSQAHTRLLQAERALLVDEVWQGALEVGYQRELARKLGMATGAAAEIQAATPAVEVQAAFCIDVRSEPMRRALEAVWPAVQTLGFAGFFGLPVAYTPLATSVRRPQLPACWRPRWKSPTGSSRPTTMAPTPACRTAPRRPGASALPGPSRGRRPAAGLARPSPSWKPPGSATSASSAGGCARTRPPVRATTWKVCPRAIARCVARRSPAWTSRPRWPWPRACCTRWASTLTSRRWCCWSATAARARTTPRPPRSIAAPAAARPARSMPASLRGCSTSRRCARACAHRASTSRRPAASWPRCTTPPPTRSRVWTSICCRPMPARAGSDCRRCSHRPATRCGANARPALVLTLACRTRSCSPSCAAAPATVRRRGRRGLAGNAAFVIGPRHRTRGVVLDGRSFLHDYDAARDADGSVLELLMTAPMLVTHWINWQYHASTCDPQRMGSGNKVLHNVVGGQIGVFEGNGGDLRIGLSRQSLHDGQRWVHEPLRLTVVIDAPREAIERVIARHAVVRQLLDHGWLHLWRFDPEQLVRYSAGDWLALGQAAS